MIDTLLDQLSELVYVADLETYDLLFINKSGLESFGLTSSEGKCYKVLQGFDEPCSFCTNKLLKPNSFYSWEITNTINKRHYFLKDQLIDWNGSKARMEIAFDMTETEQQKEQLQFGLEMQTLLLDCIKSLQTTDILDDVISLNIAKIGSFVKASRAYVFRIDGKKMSNIFEWCNEGVAAEIDNLKDLDVNLIDRWFDHFAQDKCVITNDIEELKDSCPEEYTNLKRQNITSLITVPLILDEKLWGYIGVDDPLAGFSQSISLLLNTFGNFLMSTLKRCSYEEKLVSLSYYDTLCGVYNRNKYLTDVEEIENDIEMPIGIVYLDINSLKEVNDRFGHSAGDRAIIDIVNKLKACFPNESIYRIGGDEFIVLCHWDEQKLVDSVTDLKNTLQFSNEVNAAVGFTWSAHSSTIQQQISKADQCMYEDKRRHYINSSAATRYRHYNDDMLQLTHPDKLMQEIMNNRFVIYMQPKISYPNRHLAGAEALVRYLDGNDKIVSPIRFIPILEQAELIDRVDFFVFDKVCDYIQKCLVAGKKVVPISVNFSRATILREDFIEHLTRVWSKYDVAQKYLEVEITESAECDDKEKMFSIIKSIKLEGFNIAIDDFGAKYSNVSLLAEVKVDIIKIDKSLIDTIVDNKNTQVLMDYLTNLCHKLNTAIIVEGVETEDQSEILNGFGCDGAQGYLFAKPMTIEDYEKYMSEHSVDEP